MKIADIGVIETIKQGKTVYRRDVASKNLGAIASCAESAACFSQVINWLRAFKQI